MSIDQIQELKFCNQSRIGRKSVLQERALELLKKDTLTQKIQFKIRELNLVQNGLTKSSIPELPLLQGDSSSSECTITDDMSIGYNSKSHVPDYFSMPKFDFGLASRNNQSNLNKPSAYTTLANVQFKPIPFDDVRYTLVEPTYLPSVSKTKCNVFEYSFKLKAVQANEITTTREYKNNKFEFNSQIHLRICLNEPYKLQDDYLPLNLNVRLNSKTIPLPSVIPNNKPNVESKRPSKPIDLTPYCKLSPITLNHLSIQWSQDLNSGSQKSYCFTIYIVKKLTSKDLLKKLNDKGIMDSLVTQKLIISKLQDNDNEISTTSLKSNLNCPLGKMRLQIPVRSDQCNHIQCFDAELYLQMNERKPSWLCPVCDKKAEYKTLFIDGLFTQILKEAPADSNEIEFTEDGSWKIVQNLNKTINLTPLRRKIEEDTLDTSSIKKSKTEEEKEVIELSSDSDDDDNENVQQQQLSMPKANAFTDNNLTKSIGSAGSFSLNQFSSLSSSICNNQTTGNNSRGGLITRPTHESNYGSYGLNNFNHGSSNSNMLGRISSDVISID